MKFFNLVFFAVTFFSVQSYAALHTATIKRVGCHINSNVCFAYIDGSITSTSNCTSNDNSFRWDSSGENGKSALSILLAAHAAGKKVQFGESGCYANFPSFTYVIITES